MKFPDHILTSKDALEVAALYEEGSLSPRERLAILEMEALFLVLVELLKKPGDPYESVEIILDGEARWISLRGNDDPDLHDPEEHEGLEKMAISMLHKMPLEDHADFLLAWEQGGAMTLGNVWEVAERVLGSESASALQANALGVSTPSAPSKRPRARA